MIITNFAEIDQRYDILQIFIDYNLDIQRLNRKDKERKRQNTAERVFHLHFLLNEKSDEEYYKVCEPLGDSFQFMNRSRDGFMNRITSCGFTTENVIKRVLVWWLAAITFLKLFALSCQLCCSSVRIASLSMAALNLMSR